VGKQLDEFADAGGSLVIESVLRVRPGEIIDLTLACCFYPSACWDIARDHIFGILQADGNVVTLF
jgi:hypothetical protein